MNPDTNKFEPLMTAEQQDSQLQRMKAELAGATGALLRPDGSEVPKHWSVFRVDELVVVKDYTFKVVHIGESYMVIEPQKP
jgi:hypothetical protein